MQDRFLPGKFLEVAVENIRHSVISGNFEGVVLGVSGGIDSTVVAKICILSLKEINKRVVGLMLIDRRAKNERYNIEILKQIGLELICKDITSFIQKEENLLGLPPRWLVVTLFRLFLMLPRPVFQRAFLWVRKPPLPHILYSFYKVLSLPHRLRREMLEEFAIRHNLLKVVCTNLTERLTGYFIEGGIDDLRGCDIAPISSLLKSEVYGLAEYLKIPKEIIEQSPSPGFGGIYDEQILGPYVLLDRILSHTQIEEVQQIPSRTYKGKYFMSKGYVKFIRSLQQLSSEKQGIEHLN